MRCLTSNRLMSRQLDRELSPAELARLSQHLEHCTRCQATWVAMQRVHGSLQQPPWAEPPPGLTGRVLARLPAQRRAIVPPAWVWTRAGLVVTAATVLLLVGLLGVIALIGLAPGQGGWALVWQGGRNILGASLGGVLQLLSALGHVASALWQGLRWPWVPLLVLFVAGTVLLWWLLLRLGRRRMGIR